MGLHLTMKYVFKEFSLDPERFELCRNGVPVKTEPQVIELLTFLVRNSERMISKDEINQQIWHGRVVSDSALSSRIKALRQLLGDSGKTQEIIQTVHRKGFRFIAEVRTEDVSAVSTVEGMNEPEASHARPTIAVLPFVNLSADKDEEYFSDGISSDVIAHLGKHRWLNVIARNTTFGFKGSTTDVKQLGLKLRADYLVDGSVRRAGKRIRVAVSLIDAGTGFQVWSEQYDRDIDDIFAVQDEITQTVAARLEPEIGYAERHKIAISRPANLQVWDCYQLGIFHFYEFTSAGNRKAQELLKKAQSLDGNFGEAYAWWSYAVVLGMVYWDTAYSRNLLDEALQACNKALAIDRRNATFHALKARVHLARWRI